MELVGGGSVIHGAYPVYFITLKGIMKLYRVGPFIADPSWCNSTTKSGKKPVTFETMHCNDAILIFFKLECSKLSNIVYFMTDCIVSAGKPDKEKEHWIGLVFVEQPLASYVSSKHITSLLEGKLFHYVAISVLCFKLLPLKIVLPMWIYNCIACQNIPLLI